MAPADEYLVPATQPEPAYILPGKNITETRIGESAELPCNAVGWPKPTVTWWRETTMLPFSSWQYEQLANYSLLIRSVIYEDRGEYSCHAHNGIGSGAIYKVTLIIELQPVPHSPHNEDGEYSARDSEPLATYEGPKYPDHVPLAVHMSLATDEPTVGSPIQIDCEIQGPALDVSVTWYHNGIQILENDKKRILPNNTLFLSKAEISDTGEYRCSATHSNGAASSSSLFLTIKEAPVASTCIDSPQFNNCELIVKNKYCNNKIYGQYCCASCLKAGQLQNIPTE
ncbi:Papilin, partial [Stegodyphus mimosarum]